MRYYGVKLLGRSECIDSFLWVELWRSPLMNYHLEARSILVSLTMEAVANNEMTPQSGE